MTKIALFGTSADPPTIGHQTILKWLASNYDLVVVWASDNPFKKHQTSLTRRSEMLQLTIEEIKTIHHNIQLHPELSDRYTLVTINKAREIWQEAEFTLVIGTDLVEQISKWYRVRELLQQVRLLIIPRSEYNLEPQALAQLNNLGCKYQIANFKTIPTSSTAYRLNKDRTVLTPAVKTYIDRHNLYYSSIVNY
jgi:nicotinate-nucleotide adenylyltransferase